MQLTPVEECEGYFLKRDDLWSECGVAWGGKARSLGVMFREARASGAAGVSTISSRTSFHFSMYRRLANYYGLPVHLHLPSAKEPLPELCRSAVREGSVVTHEHSPGYYGVLNKRARDHARECNFNYAPLGFDWPSAIASTAEQVSNLPEVDRIVVSVGSACVIRGVATGVETYFIKTGRRVPQLVGVYVGTKPKVKLPWFCILASAHSSSFSEPAHASIGSVNLDPYYEAKCLPYLRKGDLLWIVTHRNTQ